MFFGKKFVHWTILLNLIVITSVKSPPGLSNKKINIFLSKALRELLRISSFDNTVKNLNNSFPPTLMNLCKELCEVLFLDSFSQKLLITLLIKLCHNTISAHLLNLKKN